jgi:hypothetical protein
VIWKEPGDKHEFHGNATIGSCDREGELWGVVVVAKRTMTPQFNAAASLRRRGTAVSEVL